MIPKIETSLWLAFKDRITSMPLTIAKAWPGETFTFPTAGGKPLPFLRVGRVSASPIRQMLAAGQAHERNGFIIVTLVYPLGQSVSVYDEIAGTIAEHFKDGTALNYGSVCAIVTSYPHVAEGYTENGYWEIPVRIPWRCYA